MEPEPQNEESQMTKSEQAVVDIMDLAAQPGIAISRYVGNKIINAGSAAYTQYAEEQAEKARVAEYWKPFSDEDIKKQQAFDQKLLNIQADRIIENTPKDLVNQKTAEQNAYKREWVNDPENRMKLLYENPNIPDYNPDLYGLIEEENKYSSYPDPFPYHRLKTTKFIAPENYDKPLSKTEKHLNNLIRHDTHLIKVFLDESYEENPLKEITTDDKRRFILDEHLSIPSVKVYVDKANKHVVIAHRGTVGKPWQADWRANILMGLAGRETDQTFVDAGNVEREARIKFLPKFNLIKSSSGDTVQIEPNTGYIFSSLGHSKGGRHAQKFGKEFKSNEILTVNAPCTFWAENRNREIPDEEFNYASKYDVVSGACQDGKTVTGKEAYERIGFMGTQEEIEGQHRKYFGPEGIYGLKAAELALAEHATGVLLRSRKKKNKRGVPRISHQTEL